MLFARAAQRLGPAMKSSHPAPRIAKAPSASVPPLRPQLVQGNHLDAVGAHVGECADAHDDRLGGGRSLASGDHLALEGAKRRRGGIFLVGAQFYLEGPQSPKGVETIASHSRSSS